jgi:hypothetical protein
MVKPTEDEEMNELTHEQMRKIEESSRLATACLVTVSIHVTINGHEIHVYAMPWDCLDTASKFITAGATSVFVWPGAPGVGYWTWYAAEEPKRSRRAA